VATGRVGDRFTAQLDLEERNGDEVTKFLIDVPGEFATEARAEQVGQDTLLEWRAGRVTSRALILQELAAAYRHLREKHAPMEPILVPTTGVSWERALALWELAGWLDPELLPRYREHARWAFDVGTGTVKRHRLLDVEPDSAS
jgi:hypothetical protein